LNIFFIDRSPEVAAQQMVDKHVVKMVLETAQLLSMAHRVLDGRKVTMINNGRKRTSYVIDHPITEKVFCAASGSHVNHPCAIWVRESIHNYDWLAKHFFALAKEYTYRYGKIHKLNNSDFNTYAIHRPYHIPVVPHTPVKLAMPDEYKVSDDPIECYRNYYKYGKSSLHKWKKRPVPDWIT